MSIIEVHNLDFSYNGETVLQDVNLAVAPQDYIAIIGPNGGGKTTLLKLILGLLKPDRGWVRVAGKLPQKASTSIGYVPQDVYLNTSFPVTAMDVVRMGMLDQKNRFSKQKTSWRKEVMAALERMEMAALAQEKIGMLSGGQRQRVFIARALVTKPKLLLLDEPTASIDTKGQMDLYRILKELNGEMTILMVSHDLMAISSHVKSVACVNKDLHYHDQAEITCDMLETMYPYSMEDVCPVELVAHGIPHRVLQDH